jgi:hypothetical protein
VESVPGLYFIGLEFLYAAASATLPGVGRDARHLAKRMRPPTAAQPANRVPDRVPDRLPDRLPDRVSAAAGRDV